MKISEVKKLIGNTPMIKIKCIHDGVEKHVFAKLEWYSITGSIKDRAAFYIIDEAIKGIDSVVPLTSRRAYIFLSAGTKFPV